MLIVTELGQALKICNQAVLFRGSKQTSCRGFTLVELVIVLVLISILSAQALPRFFNLSSYQQKVLFDDTLNALRYAQKLAITSHCNVQFVITGNAYSLKQPASSSNCGSQTAGHFTVFVKHPSAGDNYTGSESGVTLSNTTLYFNAAGVVSASAVIAVGGGRSITVIPSTGFVYDSTTYPL